MFHLVTALSDGILPGLTLAYIGPGGGLYAIGAFLAIVVAIVAALFGFVWYPIKRALRGRKRKKAMIAGQSAD